MRIIYIFLTVLAIIMAIAVVVAVIEEVVKKFKQKDNYIPMGEDDDDYSDWLNQANELEQAYKETDEHLEQ